MSLPSNSDLGRMPAELLRRVVAACDRYEADWRAGRSPRIEDHLVADPGPVGTALLQELLALELELRRERGERPEAGEYHLRFPGEATMVADAFARRSTELLEPAEQEADRPRVHADHGLLLGLLALQNGFIDRDALLGAFATWVADKTRPLSLILRDRGALDATTCVLLEALARKHLELHGDDPVRSLSALSPPGPMRRDLEQLNDPELHASLAHVAVGPVAREDPYSTRSFADQATSSGLRFRILRPHARGGLGEVFVAHDEELGREVALKQIQDRHANDPAIRSRFLAEAEITGGLEHPGIIPVYGLGTYGDGRPFYAMRFVRGDSLKQAIRRFHEAEGPGRSTGECVLELRRLLGRFVDVCNAIAYAHSRGVLHRDLKPGNVMLGPYGETLVVDWGLAKLVRRPGGPAGSSDGTSRPVSAGGLSRTLPGSALGTPAYMSPEQARGELDRLGPASDVYGLGATLYHLLAGRAPFTDADLHAVQQRVVSGEFPRPRQARPDVPSALEAVCLKAMALEPGERYGSPRELADEIEHWLADEPVRAYREPWAERARRWTRRHRTAVAATVAALVVASVGLGALGAVQTRARLDLAVKNGELEGVNRSLVEQRRRAEDREAQAIDAVKKFRDVVANEPELKNTPALDGLRKRLLKEPLAFFRALRDRLQADRDTRTESLARLAKANFDLGNLTDEIGDKQDALIAYRESLAIWQRLADADPVVTAFQNELAGSHYTISRLLSATGRPAEALKANESALAIRRKLAEANPSDTAFQGHLAASYNSLGNLLSATGPPAEALKAYESALATWEKLAEANPSVTAFQSALAGGHYNVGVLLSGTGRPAEALKALKAFETALATWGKLAEANPSVTAFQSHVAGCHQGIGLMLSATGRPAEAMKAQVSALAIRRKLAEANPSVTAFQSDLATSHLDIGVLLSATGRPAEAFKTFESALAIRRMLVQEHPKLPDFARDLGETLNNLANLDLAAKRFEEARVRLREAVEWQRKALASNPANPHYRQMQADILTNLIEAARGLGDSKGVAEAERELEELRDSDPAMVALDARLSSILQGDQQPRDNHERLRLAQRAYDKALHAAAAKLWADALNVAPKLAEDREARHSYNAARAAALAGSGRGKDDPKPEEAAKARLRTQALGWLRAELSAWKDVVAIEAPERRELVAETLAQWKRDTDLAGLREPSALDAIPEAERHAWRALWAELDSLLVKLRAK